MSRRLQHERELSKLRIASQDCIVAVRCSPPPRDVNFRKKVDAVASMREPIVKRLELDKMTEKPAKAQPSNGTERDHTETEKYCSDDEGDKDREDHSREDPVYLSDTHLTSLSEKERLQEQLRMIAWSVIYLSLIHI